MKHVTTLLALALATTVPFLQACNESSGGGGGPPAASTQVSGTVSSLGLPLDEYVTLTFTPAGGGAAVAVETGTDGTYVADLTPGTWDLVATRPGYDDYTQLGIVVAQGVVTALDFAMVTLPANTYVGSMDCGVCHPSQYDTFVRTGHPYKVNKVVGGVPPTYPFTSLAGVLGMIFDDDTDPADPKPGTDNSLGTPLSWSDLTYVIGGFRWKARFIDADGYIVTGSQVQYNFFTDAMSGYHDNEIDKVFNCGNCHTTGWRHVDPGLNPVGQDGLAGMDGTFAMTGIQCEACHGAGSLHAQTKNLAFITREAQPRTTAQLLDPMAGYGLPVACGECHTRDGERDYPAYASAFDGDVVAAGGTAPPMGGRINASGGMIRHHEQYDEILGIDPDDPLLASTRPPEFMQAHGRCNACHDPHTTVVYQDVSGDPPGVRTDCLDCHADKQFTAGGHVSLDCTECHMPLLAKSATLTFDPPPGDDRPPQGDVRSHIFKIDINVDPATSQFTPDGKYAYPVITGTHACKKCHSFSGPSFEIGFPFPVTLHS